MATFTVTSLTDGAINASDDGTVFTLREAIAAAQANGAGTDNIVFQQDLAGTITAGLLAIVPGNNISINGDTNSDGNPDIILAGNSTAGQLFVSNGSTVSLQSLRFTGGNFSNALYSGAGSISNSGNLSIAYCEFADNSATVGAAVGAVGFHTAGAIFNAGILNITESTLSGGSAVGGQGGVGAAGHYGYRGGSAASGILNIGTLSVSHTVISGGTATGGTGGMGGPHVGANGFVGGVGGSAAHGVMNYGTITAVSSVDNRFQSTITAGSGGQGSVGAYGFSGGTTSGPGIAFNKNNYTGALYSEPHNGTKNDDTVSITFGAAFNGLNGHDIITGAGVNTIFGGAGHDNIMSSGGSHVYGGVGDDFIVNLAVGGGIWDGGAGIDTLDVSGDTFDDRVFDLSGDNSFTLLNGSVFTGFEHITGSGGRDTIIGNNLVNILNGGNGDDTINGGAGGDTIDGGAGLGDTADYRTSIAGQVSINLLLDTASGGEATGDTLDNIENLMGSLTLRDILVGDNGANRIQGFGGNDSIRGEGGDDYLEGGAGADGLNGGAGANDWAGYRNNTVGQVNISLLALTATGGEATGDTLNFIENLEGSLTLRDILIGNNLTNTIIGNGGNDSIRGEGGNDFIDGGAGVDSLSGGAGIDTVIYANSAQGVTVNFNVALQVSAGEASGDSLFFFENLTGSAHADNIRGNQLTNRFSGGAGADTLDGGLGSDYLTGGAGGDTFRFQDTNFGTDTIIDWQDGSDNISVALPLETNFAGLLITNNGTTSVTVKGFNGGGTIIVKSDVAFTLDAGDFVFV
jgi:Ca2+-binding RTX toxin-like protein